MSLRKSKDWIALLKGAAKTLIFAFIGSVLIGFAVASTSYNATFGDYIGDLQYYTLILYGLAEIVICILTPGANKYGRAWGVPMFFILLFVSLVSSFGYRAGQEYEAQSKARGDEAALFSARRAESIAFDTMTQVQATCEAKQQQLKAAKDVFKVGSTALNTRVWAMDNACKEPVKDAKDDLLAARSKVASLSKNVIPKSSAIYVMLENEIGLLDSKGWAALIFLISGVIIVFGFSAIYKMLVNQRPGTYLCITRSAEAEKMIAKAVEQKQIAASMLKVAELTRETERLKKLCKPQSSKGDTKEEQKPAKESVPALTVVKDVKKP